MHAEAPAGPPVEVRNLSKTYRLGFWMSRRVRALQNLDLRIEEGSVFGLLGPNGAGKSTTIKILMNLVQPTEGTAHVFGLPASHRDARRNVGFLPENPAPYEYLTGREFVRLAGQLAGMSGHDLDQRVETVLGSVGMTKSAGIQLRRYSKGMIQRIGLAQAIVNRPKLLILDEPTSGLDPVGRRQMRDLILEERARGTTILFCTHIIPDVEALCDRVAVLVGSRLVAEGTVQELVSESASLVELTIAGLDTERVRAFGIPLRYEQELQDRLLVRVDDAQAQQLAREVLNSGGKLTQLHSAQFSLEDFFMQTLEGAQQGAGSGPGTVGGELS